MEGWIKLHRRLLEWEWYKDVNTKILFLHLLLTANYEDKKWKGQDIQRGQLITSLDHLSKETGLTIQQTRTSLNKLKSTNEITIKATKRYTLINIEKYNDYQISENENNKQVTHETTNNQQTNNTQSNNQITTTKEIKNIRNIYSILFNKYSERFRQTKNMIEKIKLQQELKEDTDYLNLSLEDQNRLYKELM